MTDPLQAEELVEHATVLATREILWMYPVIAATDQHARSLSRNRLARERGVEVRAIMQTSPAEGTQSTAYLRKLAAMGVQMRTSLLLPYRLLVVDESLALVSAAHRPDDEPGAVLLVRDPTVVRLLRRMFEFCWDGTTNALPVPELVAESADRPAATLRLDTQQLLVLRLWACGRKDSTIARELQVSPRTLRRIVSSLLRRLGVSSRFEAGLVAARHHDLLGAAQPRESMEQLSCAG
ncbi:LuxR C-terminal-related transcriptional regulator [Lentzea sp. NBRC 105346]|uniref:helix-turn-helix transcriptional regulator n=1 Tax=Lentzea sp. NBRC 105346 TaxID=3032205 RepID=UPI00255252D7|nr:LuxR C-terminal-related transcriptional regulator [Lentzea sp. NBRC 105346]